MAAESVVGEARAPGRRFSRPFFPILVFGSALLSVASPDPSPAIPDSASSPAYAARPPVPIPVERVIILGDAIRPVAFRLGYADFIAQAETVARQRGVRIMASDLAKLPYPQSVYDRVPVSADILSQLRLPRPALEKLGIRVEGWKPQPEDMSGIPASNLRFLGDTAKVLGLYVEPEALMELADYYRGNADLSELLDQGGGVTIGNIVDRAHLRGLASHRADIGSNVRPESRPRCVGCLGRSRDGPVADRFGQP